MENISTEPTPGKKAQCWYANELNHFKTYDSSITEYIYKSFVMNHKDSWCWQFQLKQFIDFGPWMRWTLFVMEGVRKLGKNA